MSCLVLGNDCRHLKESDICTYLGCRQIPYRRQGQNDFQNNRCLSLSDDIQGLKARVTDFQ